MAATAALGCLHSLLVGRKFEFTAPRGFPRSTLTLRRERGFYQRLLFLLGRQHHDHLAPFHFRKLLDHAIGLEIDLQTLQHAHADFLVSHLSAPETQRNLGLVAFVKKLDQVAQLDVVVAIIGARTELDRKSVV